MKFKAISGITYHAPLNPTISPNTIGTELKNKAIEVLAIIRVIIDFLPIPVLFS
jgi:hypothetical protein